MSLEYAYNDWCISQLAEAAGDKAKAEEYAEKGQNYRNYFDPATSCVRSGRPA